MVNQYQRKIVDMLMPTAEFLADQNVVDPPQSNFHCKPDYVRAMTHDYLPEFSADLYKFYELIDKNWLLYISKTVDLDEQGTDPLTGLTFISTRQNVVSAFTALVHELTHLAAPVRSLKSVADEFSPRIAEGAIDNYLDKRGVWTANEYKKSVKHIFAFPEIKARINKLLTCKDIEKHIARPNFIMDMKYFYGAAASIPVVERIKNGEIKFEDTLVQTERQMVEKLHELNISPIDIKKSTRDLLLS